uniref:ZIP Zinc transporter n=1 Tax=Wuchereria bancrofti TaxID=6293 RepID=A0A1I8EYP5_WUCBA
MAEYRNCQTKGLDKTHIISKVVMEEFEWPPSTSTLQINNFTSEGISEFCTNWMKTIKSAVVVQDRPRHIRPSNFIIWTVGLTCVTVISLCAAVGIVFVKKLSKRAYNHFITVLVAVGVGSLITSSTLHLLPQLFIFITVFFPVSSSLLSSFQGLGVVDGENYEFIVVMITEAGVVSIRSTDALINENGNNFKSHAFPTSGPIKGYKKRTSLLKQSSDVDSTIRSSLDMSRQAHGICVHDHEITFNQTKDSAIKTVAWMIVFGDGLHNFIDGVSIGAAFSESLLSGLSVSVSVFAEEFPHELGDVAILLNAGMNQKQALFYNLLSTITCFIGFIIGVVLGSVESLLRYIFGFSGGMFLYIALSCMMPEMKSTMEEALENGYVDAFLVLSLQTTGLALGTFSMI